MGAEGLIVTFIVDSDACPMPSSTVSLTVWEPGGSLVWKVPLLRGFRRIIQFPPNRDEFIDHSLASIGNPPTAGNDEQGMSLSPDPRALKAIISEESVTSPSSGCDE